MYELKMSGSIQSDPTSVTDATSLLSQAIDLAFKASYAASYAGAGPIAGTFTPALGAMTKVKGIVVRAVDKQSLVVRVTSAAGAAQAVPVSDLFMLRANNSGDEVTALSITGTGRIEYIIAGDQ